MEVPIDVTLLFGSLIGLFIPLFIFFVKLVIDFTTIKTKLDALVLSSAESAKTYEDVDELRTEIKILKIRVQNLENEIKKSPV